MRQSSRSIFNPLIFLVSSLAVGLLYLAGSVWGFGYGGFPLDDAWIHQTYARNLARSGQLAFMPGVPSAGSTAPLWSLLLSLGYLLRVPFSVWTHGLGIMFLGLSGWTAACLSHRLFAERWLGWLIGLFVIFEWHHTWAALSGMETILFVWLSLWLVERYVACYQLTSAHEALPCSPLSYFSLGLIGGLLLLTRPEGVGLVGLIGVHMALFGRSNYHWALFPRWIGLALGVLVLLVPYVVFHLWATGTPFPNTFYAKQAEYGVILSGYPLWWRLFGNLGPTEESVQGVFRVILIGPQILLIPGLVTAAWLTITERRLNLLMIWAWWVSFLVLYAIRLPVTYQHGRYQIPAISWLILLGAWGTARLLSRLYLDARLKPLARVAGRVIWLSLILLVVGFVGLGIQAYGRDVRIIETEMVATAYWLAQNTAPNTLIAAHDIGAIGYFAERPLIDLAGLVTPDVIPFIRDEAALLDYVLQQKASYVVTFPSWYPILTRNPRLKLRYSTKSPWAPQAGGDNMSIYAVDEP